MPRAVVDAPDLVAVVQDGGHGAAGEDRGAVRSRSCRVPLNDGVRARVTVDRAERRGEHALEPGERAQLADLGEIDEPARDAQLVLQRDARLEGGDVLLPVEEEQVADLTEVDLGPRALAEAGERLDAPEADRDVERVRELRANPARGPTRRATREHIPFEETDVDAGLREVESHARSDDAASDDDDLGGRRERAQRRTRFFRKNPRFAGRSARRRMRYGYQSGPNGEATSTL